MRLFSNEQIATIRRRSQRPEFAAARSRLCGEARSFLSEGLVPPDQPAGFYHDYFCPDHGVALVFDPKRPVSHCCPQDGRVFSGEPYDASWRWFVNHRLSVYVFELALLWRLEGGEKRRLRVAEILLGYAQRYPDFHPGGSPRYGQGRATFQSLDEAVWLIPLVRAYDLIADTLDETQRGRVGDDLLRPAAYHIEGQKCRRLHNIECWHNAALATVGICLEEAELVSLAIDKDYGFHHQLREGVRADGLWWEGSSSYHFYALAALMSLAQVAVLEDRSLANSPRLRSMFRAPLLQAHPDLTLPATNDCWFFTSLMQDVCHGVPAAAGFYEVAWGWYGDDDFGGVLASNYSRSPRTALEALLYGRSLVDVVKLRPSRGANFPHSGLAVLRSGEPSAGQDYLLFKYGAHGGSHGHPDKLAIAFYVAGQPVSPDLGSPGYGIDLHESWYRQTLSHNTVVIDGQSQPEATGELVGYDAGTSGEFGVADARVSWDCQPYAGITMRRILLWRPPYFVDLFQVECDRPRQIDWACRVGGLAQACSLQSSSRPGELTGDGYGHVVQASTVECDSMVELSWALQTGGLTMFLPQESGTRLIRGRVPNNPATEQSDIVIRRRQAAQTVFLSVFHLWEARPSIVSIPHVECPVDDVWDLHVAVNGEHHNWRIGSRLNASVPSLKVVPDGNTFVYVR